MVRAVGNYQRFHVFDVQAVVRNGPKLLRGHDGMIRIISHAVASLQNRPRRQPQIDVGFEKNRTRDKLPGGHNYLSSTFRKAFVNRRLYGLRIGKSAVRFGSEIADVVGLSV